MYEPFNLLDLYKKSNSSKYNTNKGFINLLNISRIIPINKAINLTEKFESFIDIGACSHEFSELLINKGFSHFTTTITLLLFNLIIFVFLWI